MTVLVSGGNGHLTLKFTGIGSKVGGTIIEATDIQKKDYKTREPAWFDDEKTKPIMQVRVVLEQPDGSKGNLYISGKEMMKAAREAIQASGASDIEPMGHIEFTRTGGLGQAGSAYTYSAVYTPFDPMA
jgi:hypothetical protein